VPNWFTVDLKLGTLQLTLDEMDWQSAWINFKDMDSNHVRQTQHIDLNDAKVNYGCVFLESLFKNCIYLNPLKLDTCTNTSVIISTPQNQQQQQQQQQNSQINELDNNVMKDEGGGGDDDANTSSSTKTTASGLVGNAGLLRFNIPDHTTLILSEQGGKTIYRLDLKDLSKESEQTLSQVIPAWIIDALLGVNFKLLKSFLSVF
jgi:hypothetical protein